MSCDKIAPNERTCERIYRRESSKCLHCQWNIHSTVEPWDAIARSCKLIMTSTVKRLFSRYPTHAYTFTPRSLLKFVLINFNPMNKHVLKQRLRRFWEPLGKKRLTKRVRRKQWINSPPISEAISSPRTKYWARRSSSLSRFVRTDFWSASLPFDLPLSTKSGGEGGEGGVVFEVAWMLAYINGCERYCC